MEKQIFSFVNYNVEVEIAGSTFQLDCSTETSEYIKKMAVELRNMANGISSGENTTNDAINLGCSIIDHLLGEGASEKAFAGRKKRIDDVSDICTFIIATVNKFKDERVKLSKAKAEEQPIDRVK